MQKKGMGLKMSIISEVKCARCDKIYSGVRSRCPYCTARRIGRGKHSEEADNSKGKMYIGILIMAVLVVGAGVLLFTAEPAEIDTPGASALSPPTQSLPNETTNTSEPGTQTVPPPAPPSSSPPEESPTAPPQPEVRTVQIVYGSNNSPRDDITVRVGERVPLRVRIEPLGVTDEIIWSTSNRAIFDVVPTNTEQTAARITGIARGTETLTVTVGGVTATCIIRVRPAS